MLLRHDLLAWQFSWLPGGGASCAHAHCAHWIIRSWWHYVSWSVLLNCSLLCIECCVLAKKFEFKLYILICDLRLQTRSLHFPACHCCYDNSVLLWCRRWIVSLLICDISVTWQCSHLITSWQQQHQQLPQCCSGINSWLTSVAQQSHVAVCHTVSVYIVHTADAYCVCVCNCRCDLLGLFYHCSKLTGWQLCIVCHDRVLLHSW